MSRPDKRADLEAREDGSEENEETPLLAVSKTTEHIALQQGKEMFYVLTFSVIVFGIGLVSGMYLEGWDVVTALYVLTQTITTVGYGDVPIKHMSLRLYCCFLAMYSLTVCTYVASLHFYKQMGYMHEKFLREKLVGEQSKDAADAVTRLFRPKGAWGKLLMASLPAIVDILFGTVFYALFEACTCSYGGMRPEGCRSDDYATCVKTGGFVKTWPSAFYMAVVTLSTVGYGDYSPRSRLGRGVAVVWMVCGVMAVGNWIKGVSDFISEMKNGSHLNSQEIDKHAFHVIDRSKDGYLSRSEYVNFVLIKYGLVTEDELDIIEQQYDKIDIKGKGAVSYDDIQNISEAGRRQES